MSERNTNERWFGAVCYLSFLVFIPIFVKPKTEFLAKHCRQGFALFFAEVVAIFLLWAIDGTIGRIPVLGLLISILLHLILFLTFLAASVLGFMKALSGQSWHLAFLDEFAEKVPIHASEPVEPQEPVD